jgi:hypothetical protein
MWYNVATRANTSFNQAIKDPSQRRCSYSNLGTILIKSVARTFVAARDFAGKFRFQKLSPHSLPLPLFNFGEAALVLKRPPAPTTTDNLPQNQFVVYKVSNKMKRPSRSSPCAMRVAYQVAPRCSLVGSAYDHDGILESFSRSVLRRLLRILSTLNRSVCANMPNE